MNKIRKIILISISLFLLLIVSIIIVLIIRGDFHFISRNVSPILKYYINENYDSPIRNIDVLEYDLKLDVYQKEKIIRGVAKIKVITLDNRADDIELDFYDNFKIISVKIDEMIASYIYEDNTIRIIKNLISNDTSNVEIAFEGEPQNLGMGSFSMDEKNGKQFLSTLNEPIFASTWFPCNDSPHDKAKLKISITHDSSMVTISNGNLVGTTTTGDRRTYSWATDYPIATYLISIYSAPYKIFSQKYYTNYDSMNIDYYVTEEKYENAKIDFSKHPKYLQILGELFGEYPFIKEKYGVAEILWQQGAMESQTISSIGGDFISGMNLNEDILIHEVAHHWWGNSVTLKTWKDIWLNEGFATYSEALYYEATRGKKALNSTMYSFARKLDSKNKETLYSPGVNIFSANVYNKGAWVLHMLRKEIGDSLFFTGVVAYYEKYKYSNANTEDLKSIFEIVSNIKLDKFFDQWLYKGTGFLELEITWSEKIISETNIQLKITIEQKQNGYKNYHFPLDLEMVDSLGTVTYYTPYIISDTTLLFNFKNRIKDVLIDKDNWLLAIIE
ncbi:MAG: M1 family metallopeptidase [Melioribacteraceae bacterium]|nr:M1 family metallopeptidase [Melioribacteraceae bacterium]